MPKPLISAVPISMAITTLWIDWASGVALIILMFSVGCLACHAWLCIRTVRIRLQEIPENKRSHVRLLIIRNGIRARLPVLLKQRPSLSRRPLSFRTLARV